ncbi:MAG: hypothetical protein GY757_40940, partial [bacterium]|nr:hypothetical protein [bacterium]
ERLFNITFYKNDGVIPFYFEVKEGGVWIVDFCRDFFLTFIYQYIAFKSRKTKYLGPFEESNFDVVKKIAGEEGLDYLIELIASVEHALQHEQIDTLWKIVRNAPKTIAFRQKEFIIQLIDEFQFLNSEVFWDKAKSNPAKDMAGGYLSTAESKTAPLLVSGSWVGWLMSMLLTILPSRFKFKFLHNMPEDEAIEMVFKYSYSFGVPVTGETAYLIAGLTEGSPFYISALIRSDYKEKDLTTIDGLANVLEFETLAHEGEIKTIWMEYVRKAFSRVNDINAKNIVLFLCKNKEREITRAELLEKLDLDMTDSQLESKLKALVKADIIQQGSSNFRYLGVQDNIFGKVFRGVYQEEIEHFEPGQIKKEYQAAFENLKKKYNQLQGKFNYQKGYFAEYSILDQLRYHARSKNALLKSITRNLPRDFEFCQYKSVWSYRFAPETTGGFSVDIFAPSKSPNDYSIIGEVKNRDTKKFSLAETVSFEQKLDQIKKTENLNPVMGFIFSRKGFTKDAETYCLEKGISYTEDEKWLEL